MWTRDVQNVVFAILFCGWLGGMGLAGITAEPGKLLTIEEVGKILNGKLDSSSDVTSNISQSQSTSKIETPSMSQSKNTSNPSLHSSKSLHD